MLEETDELMETAEKITLEIIEANLDVLGNKGLAEFFAELRLSEKRLEKAESREEILEELQTYVDTVKLALKIGVDILFQNDEDEDQPEAVEEEAPIKESEQPEPDFEIVCRNWKRLYMPPANKLTVEMDQSNTEIKSPRLS